jgi:hypothetical protein
VKVDHVSIDREKLMSNTPAAVVGMDVAKATLDLACHSAPDK